MPVQPPVCRTCGKAEWRHRCTGPAPIATVAITPKAKPKKKRDRRAYQRDLMRKRRSEGKA
jgi:hypothetical protein